MKLSKMSKMNLTLVLWATLTMGCFSSGVTEGVTDTLQNGSEMVLCSAETRLRKSTDSLFAKAQAERNECLDRSCGKWAEGMTEEMVKIRNQCVEVVSGLGCAKVVRTSLAAYEDNRTAATAEFVCQERQPNIGPRDEVSNPTP